MTILDELARFIDRANAAVAEAEQSGADPAMASRLAEITQTVAIHHLAMTEEDPREVAKAYPVDPPAEWPADTMARRERLRKRIDRRVNRWLRDTAPAPQAPRAESRPRARRSPRRGTAKTAQDPGSDDGDPDADPVAAAVARLVGQAPPFSPGQRDLLGRILGGSR